VPFLTRRTVAKWYALGIGRGVFSEGHMQRREFITLIGGAAAAWPLAARAQQPAMPVIGFLSTRSPDESAHLVAAFRRGLAENGYVDGQNVTIEYRWALGQNDRLPALAAELARRLVAVLVSVGAEPSARAAKAATATIPIVSVFAADPVASGLVASLNRPGGNVTGISNLSATLEAKRLGLLHELVPQAATIGILLNPTFPSAASQLRDIQEAARTIGLQLHVLRASTDREIDTAFESVAQNRIPALAVAVDTFFITRRDKLAALAARHAAPTMYSLRDYATAGGLMSYGIDLSDVYRQVGVYAGRILKGAKPADLPVVQPTKFEFVINLKTAKALGVKFSDNLMSLADEVIE
jgi:putative tryptophan/tyrosine transport system substrate-binding protein